ncbi:MAG: septal ring lytic transglycosylase RlpA family protein [bacterium]
MFKKRILIIIIFTVLIIPFAARADAEFCSLNNYSLKIDEETVKTGYTIEAFEGLFRIGIFSGALSAPSMVDLKNVTKTEQEQGAEGRVGAPEGWELNSDIYEYGFTNKDAYLSEKPLIIEIFFGKDTANNKQIFYFDKGSNQWNPLPTALDWNKKSARTKLHFVYVRLAVFDQIDIAGAGKASWYNQALFKFFKYKNGDFAASQQYPKGTKLRVKNLDNNKTVIVTVNDYGPDKWTGRIIDLDVSAFKKLAWKGMGTIDVAVEPVCE